MKNHSRPVLLLLVIIIQTACVRMKAAGNGNTQTLPYRYVNTLKTSSSDESRCLVLFSWLRSAYYGNTDDFTLLYTVKELTCAWNASTKAQVLPAFCIY